MHYHAERGNESVVMSSTKDPCISLCKVLAEAELRLLALGATGRRKSK